MNPPYPPQIDLAVERQWHIGPHVAALLQKGWLEAVYGGFPAYRYRRLGIPSRHLHTFPFPAIGNQIQRKLPFLPTFNEPRQLARFTARRSASPFLVCYATIYRWLFPLLLDSRKVLVIERGSAHPLEYHQKIEEGRREAGLSGEFFSSEELAEEVKAGGLAHFVVAGSNLIRDSYTSRGVPRDRVLTIAYGINPQSFPFFERSHAATDPIKIACVGIIGIRKGIFRLLRIGEWAQRRNLPVEMHLIGPMEAETPGLLAKFRVPVIVHGVKKGAELAAALHGCDLYALPSYEEGFGISVLEAMSTGLPSIVSRETGGAEAISEGEDGIVVPDYDDTTLDALLTPLFREKTRRLEMGRRAHAKILGAYTEAHYAARLHSEYERMFQIAAEQDLPRLRDLA